MPIVVGTPAPIPSPVPAPSSFTCSPWATVDDVCAPCSAADFDDGLLPDSLAAASDALFLLSGQRFPGECTTTVRPCAWRPLFDPPPWSVRDHRSGLFANLVSGSGSGAGWWPWGSCSCSAACSCAPSQRVWVGRDDASLIVSVTVDGTTLAPSLYRLDPGGWLVRLPDPDGTRPGWPVVQDLDLPATEPGTFEVAYVYGRSPGPLGVNAAAALGCQLALACTPGREGDCKLPKRVTTLTRQGITAVVADPTALLEKGRTGLFEVDLFLQAVNPHGLTSASTVMSPDTARGFYRPGP